MIAHMIAYAVAFVWAVAGIVPALVSLPGEALSRPVEEIKVQVLWRVGVGVAVPFALAHAVALPWARAGHDPARVARGRRLYVTSTAGLAVLGAIVSAVGWGWLITRGP